MAPLCSKKTPNHQWLLCGSDILTTVISSTTPLVFLPFPSPPIPTIDLKSPRTCGCLLQTYFTLSHSHGEGQVFCEARMGGDDTMPVVKDDDAMPVVNQDEAPVDPFGDRDDWAVGIMSKAFLKIRHVL